MRIHYSAALQALCIGLAAALPATCPAAPLELRWRAEASDPKPYSAVVFRGETVALSASLYAYNEPVALDPASACTLYWQTNGMGSAWWECPGAASTNGALSAVWSPTNDVGASLYSFFLSAETPSGRIYRARGTLRMLDSPGWNPAAAPAPSCYPDLAAGLVPHVSPLLDALYAPAWAGVAAHTNAPAIHLTPEQADKIANSITSAPPQSVVSVNGQTGAVEITASGLGALTNAPPLADVLAAGNTTASAITIANTAGGHYFSTEVYDSGLLLKVNGDTMLDVGTGGTGGIRANPWGGIYLGANEVVYGISVNGAAPMHGDIELTIPTDTVSAAQLDAATNDLVRTYLLSTNAWMSVSNSVLSITIVTNGVTNVVWSSSESAGGLDPSFSNAVYSALSSMSGALASKADTAWGKYTPAGEANPDPDFMTWLNAPATVFAGGCQWAASGTYAALTTAGTVAFAAGSDGQFRIGPNSTNWFGYVHGGSTLVGAVAGAITVTGGGATNGYAEIIYPYESGDFPALWFAPSLAVDFSAVEGVVWVDLTNGTARVTAPATTAAGFWYATTTMSVENYFESTMPAKFSGGVVGNTNAASVIYDSVIQVQSGNKTYRIPAQEVPQ